MKSMQDGSVRYTDIGIEHLQQPNISPNLEKRLVRSAVSEAALYWGRVFDVDVDGASLADRYSDAKASADALKLFQLGGIDVKDHINLFVLLSTAPILKYVESGVFKGSSLHAATFSYGLKEITAIDPEPENFDVRIVRDLDNIAFRFESLKDFAEMEINGCDSLVFFDDHIDTASRIQSANKAGFRWLIFDDSTGVEGICQRLYPALPTLMMIANWKLFTLGEEMAWSVPLKNPNLLSRVKSFIRYRGLAPRVKLKIDQPLVDVMEDAFTLVDEIIPFPDLSYWVPSSQVGRLNNTQKYLVKLNHSES